MLAERVELGVEFLPERRAYPMRMSALSRSGSMGAGGGVPGRHGRPGPQSAGVGTRSAFFSRGTGVKRRVWQAEATAPPRERHGEPGRASHFGQACFSTSSASDRSAMEGC
ncbi:hypothetical protein [Streptomyces sp. SID8499]|uniref:hypothetical protein n=1 Tax=Streptomyces sp. SID8499 TaxID=2706106 RepID=UPI0031BAE818